MKIATAAYPLDLLPDWTAYAEKQIAWVREAARGGADLLVFPEYARMELAGLAGPDIAADAQAAMQAVAAFEDDADHLMQELATGYGVTILCGSGPVIDAPGTRPRNRALLVGPDPDIFYSYADKQIMTPYERETLQMHPGEPGETQHTPLGAIATAICYDAEFPLIARSLMERDAFDILLVPSCTDTLAGHSRVRTGAMARALENQCITVVSATIGPAPWCPIVDENTGRGGIYGPPDLGFPDTGIIAEGDLNDPGWTLADIDLTAIARVRAEGAVRPLRDWSESAFRSTLFSDPGDLP